MAVASPHQPPTLQQLTPPNSSHGGRGSWDFAVPLDNGKTTADQKPLMSEDVPAAQLLSSRQPLAPQPNGVTKQPRSNTLDSQRQRYDEDAGYLAPTRVNELQRKGSDISANSSDPDSLLDYYKNSESKNGSRTASQTAANKKKTAGGANWTEAEKDENNWIHRDKLKEIETKELEEAGFPVGRTSRSNSRSHSASVGARDRRNSEANDAAHNGDDRHDKRRVVSPIPAEDEEGDDDPAQWDLRTPDEIAAEREISPPRNHIIRPSTSRIPIAKTSPAPVPHAYVERDVPLPRSRKGSANWTGDAIATNGARVRSGSTSSQVLMDDLEGSGDHLKTPLRGDFSSPTSPVTGSPPKAKTPGKLAPISGGRKGTAQRSTSTAKSRNTSATSPAKRPGTSGGSISRPTTGHRPEGDPPWMATMYKPDPRLPPDQQIIPTHAKRMQQEQWEIEGKHGSIYDREFRLLNTEEFNKRDSQILQPTDNQKDEDDQQWPLPSPTKNSPGRQDTGLKSPTNEQGGYKLTPKIPQSPRIPSRNSGHRSTASPKNTNTTRLPEPSAEEKQKKNCCCISDGEEPTSPVEAAAEVEVSADAATGKGQMSVLEALKGVLKLALIHDGLARGLREASKALDRRQAHMCVLNEACEEEAYKKLVVALCSEHKIPLIKVPDGKQLGEWAGLCQIDREGNPRKVVNCSCVVVRDWGEESQERSILLNYFQTEQ
ncbi:uncharacterized protein BDR25DRAFT_330930 [Lindgomyces ingoldianus]|uniref:Uncharacterized protein n=1 Tax=Lindgomyces ingoldianus TaxID=673940 RepID=A0ACB6RCE7_9PLEO|nr:uncharacterized protein BDR25DRAFT_330930 [Lindgomyces ingoldianus]KAF2477003.1 hypothetical protein BDR25DRAFT_330930 [Lindgomyces ingoldianus]